MSKNKTRLNISYYDQTTKIGTLDRKKLLNAKKCGKQNNDYSLILILNKKIVLLLIVKFVSTVL